MSKSENIDAIVLVNVRDLLNDHPDGYTYNYVEDGEPSPLSKYYEVFTSKRFSDTRSDGTPQIICNVRDNIVFRALSRSGSGHTILLTQFAAKTPSTDEDFNTFISPPQFLTASGEGRAYGSTWTGIWWGWQFMKCETVQGPDRTAHFLQITALRDTLSQTGGVFEKDMRYLVGFTLRNDDGVWVTYQYDPWIKIRPQGTAYNK
jgi:hypothetical protein